MRILLMLWAFPLIFFWGWYGLSAFDINFGIQFFTRRTHDIVFNLYGNILGMPAADVPLALVKIFAFDSIFIFALAAWRWRKSWYPQTKKWVAGRYYSTRRFSQEALTDNGLPQGELGQEVLGQESLGQEWLMRGDFGHRGFRRERFRQETVTDPAHLAE